jgi:hypothetical protein
LVGDPEIRKNLDTDPRSGSGVKKSKPGTGSRISNTGTIYSTKYNSHVPDPNESEAMVITNFTKKLRFTPSETG